MNPHHQKKHKRLVELLQRPFEDLTEAEEKELLELQEWRAQQRGDGPGRFFMTYTPPDGGEPIDLDEEHARLERERQQQKRTND